MIPVFRSIVAFFNPEKTVYSHRNRTIEMVASEKNIDINSIKNETRAIRENEGSVVAVIQLRKRFHVTSSAAWNFVDKLK